MPDTVRIKLATADVPNRNGRIYPRAVLERAALEARNALIPVAATPDNVQLDLLLGVVEGLDVDERGLNATVKLVDNAAGQGLQRLLSSGFGPLFTMSGVGSFEEQPDGLTLVKDFRLNGIVISQDAVNKLTKLKQVLLAKLKKTHERKRP